MCQVFLKVKFICCQRLSFISTHERHSQSNGQAREEQTPQKKWGTNAASRHSKKLKEMHKSGIKFLNVWLSEKKKESMTRVEIIYYVVTAHPKLYTMWGCLPYIAHNCHVTHIFSSSRLQLCHIARIEIVLFQHPQIIIL